MTQPEPRLTELLLQLFSEEELRRFVASLPGGPALAASLPGGTASPGTVAAEAAVALARHGLIDRALFRRLRQERPRRADDIATVEAACLGPVAAEEPATPRSSRARAERADDELFAAPHAYAGLEHALLTAERAVVVEGPQGSGKTTLIRHALAAAGPFDHVSCRSPIDAERLPSRPGRYVVFDDAHRLTPATRATLLDRLFGAVPLVFVARWTGAPVFDPDPRRIFNFWLGRQPRSVLLAGVRAFVERHQVAEPQLYMRIPQLARGSLPIAAQLCRRTRESGASGSVPVKDVVDRLTQRFHGAVCRYILSDRSAVESRLAALQFLNGLEQPQIRPRDLSGLAGTPLSDCFRRSDRLLELCDPSFHFYLGAIDWDELSAELGAIAPIDRGRLAALAEQLVAQRADQPDADP